LDPYCNTVTNYDMIIYVKGASLKQKMLKNADKKVWREIELRK